LYLLISRCLTAAADSKSHGSSAPTTRVLRLFSRRAIPSTNCVQSTARSKPYRLADPAKALRS
jgi:hypothetical protein